jgi:hypothetical protein
MPVQRRKGRSETGSDVTERLSGAQGLVDGKAVCMLAD